MNKRKEQLATDFVLQKYYNVISRYNKIAFADYTVNRIINK